MKHIKIYPVIFAILVLLLATTAVTAETRDSYDYDVLIYGGKVFDGSLNPPFKADVAVKNGKIVKVAKNIKKTNAKKIINAKGLFITPGFIDIHTHAEGGMFYPETAACLNYLTQGVTSVVVGQCGSSGWPIYETLADQQKRWQEKGIGPNAAMLVGHGTVREIVMGEADRPPSAEELEKMKTLVKEAMEQGASGLSTGLIYKPGRFADTAELIELVKVIVPYGGIYHSHIRNEANDILKATAEAIEIGEKTGAPVHISHIKIMGGKNWGKLNEACALIEAAQKRGLKVTADQYPYRFTNNYPYTGFIPRETWLGDNTDLVLQREDVIRLFDSFSDAQLRSLNKKIRADAVLSQHFDAYLEKLPRVELLKIAARALFNSRELSGPWNSKERVLFWQRWKNPAEAEKIRREVGKFINRSGAANLIIARCVEKNLEGKSLLATARIKGKPVPDTAVELHLMGALAVPLRMCEADIEYAMKKDYVATGSDGIVPFYGINVNHIRGYGTFLHKIKKYGLERKTVSLSHIIRSQTSLPARIMNWPDRGFIEKNYIADIAVIDLGHIDTCSSISNPHCYSKGVEYLLINGEVVIEKGSWNGKLPGRVIVR